MLRHPCRGIYPGLGWDGGVFSDPKKRGSWGVYALVVRKRRRMRRVQRRTCCFPGWNLDVAIYGRVSLVVGFQDTSVSLAVSPWMLPIFATEFSSISLGLWP